jgi:AcrR family transcriptional regulator
MPATASPSPTALPRGRPRSQRARRAVLEATFALIEKGGYAVATIEAISARSGVAKTTIYRWWPNRPALVVDLLMELAAATVPPPSGPDPLGAVRQEMRGIAEAPGNFLGQLLVALLGEAQCDPEIRTALLERLFLPRSEATAKMIRQAQKAGLVRREVPALTAVDLLVGPLFYRMFVRHQPLNAAFATQVFRFVMNGLEVPRTRSSANPSPPAPRNRRVRSKRSSPPARTRTR